MLLLAGSLVINFYAGTYANESESNHVTDIVLSNTRVYDVNEIFILGMIVFFAFITIWCLRYPWQAPYILRSIATFVIIRAVFVSLTHLWPFPDSIPISSYRILGKINFWADLFFSGHTGLPFLMALIFWERIYLRYIFITAAVVFGIVVLLGHLHYSIDVLAAFFITYTIHHLCERIRKSDKIHFQNAHPITYK